MNNINVKNSGQFCHIFCLSNSACSNAYNLVEPILQFAFPDVSSINVSRGKANLLMKDSIYPDNYYHAPHTDVSIDDPSLSKYSKESFKSVLYYVNDSDGDTFFFNEKLGDSGPVTINKRITPKANTAIIFDSNIYHASSSPKITERRLVINFVCTLENI